MNIFTSKQATFLLSVLISLFSINLYAADFTIEVNPSANSVDDSKISSISSSKISDLTTILANYLLKSDVPDCQNGQFLTKIANTYSCVSPTVQDTNPVGTILAFASGTCPTGYLTADGASVSRTTYANLFTAIGSAHGTADGNSFNIPDYRGRFLRMVDGTAGRDPDKTGRSATNLGGATGNNVGSVQSHAFQTHGHNYYDPGHTHYTSLYIGDDDNASGAPDYMMVDGDNGFGYQNRTSSLSAINIAITTPNSGNVSSETRPINAYVNYCIKY